MGMGIKPEVKRSHRNNISYMVIHRQPIKYHLFSGKNNTIEINHKGIKNYALIIILSLKIKHFHLFFVH